MMSMGTLPTGVLPQHPECPQDTETTGGGTLDLSTWAVGGRGLGQPQRWVSSGCTEGLRGLAELGRPAAGLEGGAVYGNGEGRAT